MHSYLAHRARLTLLCTCLLWIPRVVQAAPSESSVAQALFDDAKSLMKQGDYAAACPKLEESQRLDPALGTLLNLADCREKEGNVATAWSLFRDAESLAKRGGHSDAEEVAHSRVVALTAQVPRLLIKVTPGQPKRLRIVRNDVDVGAPQWGTAVPLDPGRYELVASAPGHQEFRTSVTLELRSGTVSVVVPQLSQDGAEPTAVASRATENDAASSPAPERRRVSSVPTATWVLGGIGLAAVGTSLTLGAWAKSQYDSADCPDHLCKTSEELEQREAARTKATAATIVFAAGAAALIGGVTLWAVRPTTSEPTSAVQSLRLRAGLGSVSLFGTW